jgi:hypothetical protein
MRLFDLLISGEISTSTLDSNQLFLGLFVLHHSSDRLFLFFSGLLSFGSGHSLLNFLGLDFKRTDASGLLGRGCFNGLHLDDRASSSNISFLHLGNLGLLSTVDRVEFISEASALFSVTVNRKIGFKESSQFILTPFTGTDSGKSNLG